MAIIESIVYQPNDRTPDPRLDRFDRVPVSSVLLVENHGIEGDRKAGRNPRRQLNLLSREWLEVARTRGYKVEPGDFGEQLIVRGIAVETLEPGSRLQLGNQAVIEVTKARTGCTRLEAAQGQSIASLGSIGTLARIVAGGPIQVGDAVLLLPAVSARS